jgi:hypothetical protein
MHINKMKTKFKNMNRLFSLIALFVIINLLGVTAAQTELPEDLQICELGSIKPCGSNVGECEAGERVCTGGIWEEECRGGTVPAEEICGNDLDDDCNGEVDDCFFEFPIPGWVLVALGGLLLIGAWVYEKITVVKEEELHQEEEIGE